MPPKLPACLPATATMPDWKITGKNMTVTIEGYGTIHHAALWAKQVPVLYSPYLIFPAKTERQSGLLVPEAGYSERNGFQFSQPFYWAINDQSDATFTFEHIANRGEKIRSGIPLCAGCQSQRES